MQYKDDILMEGEEFIGDYNIEIARWSNNQWTPTVPPLYVVVTDHRVVLQPHGRKSRQPAIIPASYILHARPFDDSRRCGVLLSIKGGIRIAVLIARTQRLDFMRNLRTIAMPAARKERKFEPQLDLGVLHRLIDHVTSL